MKKRFLFLFVLFNLCLLYAKTYDEHIADAKKFEKENKWCYALGAYYDALGTDIDPFQKIEAYESFITLKNAIESGNPGTEEYDIFTFHDKWKDLLIDAEKYASSFNPYEITVGALIQGPLNYDNKTASYKMPISYKLSNRYMNTIGIIANGYKKAYKEDWNDLPKEWPTFSASYNKDGNFDVDGVGIFYYEAYGKFQRFENAFITDFTRTPLNSRNDESSSLIDCKFVVVDNNGHVLVESERCLLGADEYITFINVGTDIIEKISKKEVIVKPIGYFLRYGKYNYYDDKGGRSFVKNLFEKKLSIQLSTFLTEGSVDEQYVTFESAIKEISKMKRELGIKQYFENKSIEMIELTTKRIEIGKTEVTQELYTAVMGDNPSYFKGINNPVECVSIYDAMYFCNLLSLLSGLDCVYKVDNKSNPEDWEYIPHKGQTLYGIEENQNASGYRLPTIDEWVYAAKGDENFLYAGSSDVEEVAFYKDNSDGKTHPVAQKKPNSFGLYDMSGNVWEWTSDYWGEGGGSYTIGGCWKNDVDRVDLEYPVNGTSSESQYNSLGFRLVRSIQLEEIIIDKNIVNELIPMKQIPESNFEIMQHEVTQELYEFVMNDNPSIFVNSNYPVENVTFFNVLYLCNKLSIGMGLEPVYEIEGEVDPRVWENNEELDFRNENFRVYSINIKKYANGYRLPTADEWMLAAHGKQKENESGTNVLFSLTGIRVPSSSRKKYSGGNNLNFVGWYKSNSKNMTHPIMQKKANTYGLFDMSGNVSELTVDGKVMGGSCLNSEEECLLDNFYYPSLENREDCIGFRLVRNIK